MILPGSNFCLIFGGRIFSEENTISRKKLRKLTILKTILVGFEWNEVISEMRKKSENAQN